MNANRYAIIGVTIAVALFYAAHPGTNAQNSAAHQSANPKITWMGNAVFGVESPGIVGGPFPRAEKGIEIGLRADGVVVWRKSTSASKKLEEP
ncbi:MAG: hypothetical protein ACTHMT_14135 [Verrucomicrobiota bacterium]